MSLVWVLLISKDGHVNVLTILLQSFYSTWRSFEIVHVAKSNSPCVNGLPTVSGPVGIAITTYHYVPLATFFLRMVQHRSLD